MNLHRLNWNKTLGVMKLTAGIPIAFFVYLFTHCEKKIIIDQINLVVIRVSL